jgi:hypothetical protein
MRLTVHHTGVRAEVCYLSFMRKLSCNTSRHVINHSAGSREKETLPRV